MCSLFHTTNGPPTLFKDAASVIVPQIWQKSQILFCELFDIFRCLRCSIRSTAIKWRSSLSGRKNQKILLDLYLHCLYQSLPKNCETLEAIASILRALIAGLSSERMDSNMSFIFRRARILKVRALANISKTFCSLVGMLALSALKSKLRLSVLSTKRTQLLLIAVPMSERMHRQIYRVFLGTSCSLLGYLGPGEGLRLDGKRRIHDPPKSQTTSLYAKAVGKVVITAVPAVKSTFN